MDKKTRTIEVDEATAEALESEARTQGLTVASYLKSLVSDELPPDLAKMRAEGRGPWSPEALAEDARDFEEIERTGVGVPFEEVAAWMRSWGTENELPMPKPRKLWRRSSYQAARQRT